MSWNQCTLWNYGWLWDNKDMMRRWNTKLKISFNLQCRSLSVISWILFFNSSKEKLMDQKIERSLNAIEERSISRILPRVARVAMVNQWPMTSILYLGHPMEKIYVRELVAILYIGNDVPFCKKCIVWTMLNTHTHTHFMENFMNFIDCLFYVDECMNFIVCLFYVDECMNFKVFLFPLFSIIYEIARNKSNLNGCK